MRYTKTLGITYEQSFADARYAHNELNSHRPVLDAGVVWDSSFSWDQGTL